MLFNVIFNIITVISQQTVHQSILSWIFFTLTPQYSFQATGFFSKIIITKYMDTCERGTMTITMIIIHSQKEYWLRQGSALYHTVLTFNNLEKGAF